MLHVSMKRPLKLGWGQFRPWEDYLASFRSINLRANVLYDWNYKLVQIIHENGRQVTLKELQDALEAIEVKLNDPVQTPKAQELSSSNYRYDFFLSHSSADNDQIARPLYSALIASKASVWFDEVNLALGDKLQQSIDRGLAVSRYGIVILSKAYFAGEWPNKELEALVALETIQKRKLIFPIWHNLSEAEVAEYSPTLAGRLAGNTTDSIDKLVAMIKKAMPAATVVDAAA